MKIKIQFGDVDYIVNRDQANSIAIDLDFDGPQPSHFGSDPATRTPMKAGAFIGSTRQGGNCNVDVITLNPHCNGTHTETVGHIVDDFVPIASAAVEAFFPTVLVSVEPENAGQCGEEYQPKMEAADRVITRRALENALTNVTDSLESVKIESMVVRSLPNDKSKKSCHYGKMGMPPYLTTDAIEFVLELGVRHLIVDVPSIDRMHDEGVLSNHHRFWNVEAGSKNLSSICRIQNTITEMVFIDDEIVDGVYLLNLQVAALGSDVSPSRPVLFEMTAI